MSSPQDDLSEASRVLAHKATEDATAVREFAANSEIADSIVGFHAQQAIEKWLKAAMASRGIRYTRTHDIDRLAETLEMDGVELPAERDRLDALSQYAVPLRYDQLLDAEPLDRDATVSLVNEVGGWVEAQLAQGAGSEEPDHGAS